MGVGDYVKVKAKPPVYECYWGMEAKVLNVVEYAKQCLVRSNLGTFIFRFDELELVE